MNTFVSDRYVLIFLVSLDRRRRSSLINDVVIVIDGSNELFDDSIKKILFILIFHLMAEKEKTMLEGYISTNRSTDRYAEELFHGHIILMRRWQIVLRLTFTPNGAKIKLEQLINLITKSNEQIDCVIGKKQRESMEELFLHGIDHILFSIASNMPEQTFFLPFTHTHISIEFACLNQLTEIFRSLCLSILLRWPAFALISKERWRSVHTCRRETLTKLYIERVELLYLSLLDFSSFSCVRIAAVLFLLDSAMKSQWHLFVHKSSETNGKVVCPIWMMKMMTRP